MHTNSRRQGIAALAVALAIALGTLAPFSSGRAFADEVAVEKVEGRDDRPFGIFFRDLGEGFFYWFAIRGDAIYLLVQHDEIDGFQALTDPIRSPAINRGNGALNRLRVVARGSR